MTNDKCLGYLEYKAEIQYNDTKYTEEIGVKKR